MSDSEIPDLSKKSKELVKILEKSYPRIKASLKSGLKVDMNAPDLSKTEVLESISKTIKTSKISKPKNLIDLTQRPKNDAKSIKDIISSRNDRGRSI